MKVGNVYINTPLYSVFGDDPAWYDPMWRHRVAMACASQGLGIPPELKDDQYFLLAYDYAMALQNGGAAQPDTLARQFGAYNIAFGWSQGKDGNPTRFTMDALLLCPSELDQILAAIKLPSELIKTYERCFFNVRMDDGKPVNTLTLKNLGLGAPQRITENSPADLQMRAQGLITPVGALMAQWGMNCDVDDGPPTPKTYRRTFDLGRNALEYNIRNNRIGNEELVALYSQEQEFELKRAEVAKEGASSGWGQLTDLMQVFAPRLMVARRADFELRDQQKALERKLLVENKIKGTVVDDKGMPYAQSQLSTKLQEQFDNATLPAGVSVNK